MMKVTDWLKRSNRWKHLTGGLLMGVLTDGWWCAALCGLCVAGALEFKDWQHGNLWDWVDFLCTAGGALLGYGMSVVLFLVFV